MGYRLAVVPLSRHAADLLLWLLAYIGSVAGCIATKSFVSVPVASSLSDERNLMTERDKAVEPPAEGDWHRECICCCRLVGLESVGFDHTDSFVSTHKLTAQPIALELVPLGHAAC